MTLGERIRILRMQRNLSQEDLAAALEVSRQSVSKWENNAATPDLEKLCRLCNLFGVSLDELVRGEPQPQKTAEPVPEALPQKQKSPGQRTAGIVLLCMATVPLWAALLTGGAVDLALLLGLPLAVCGLICLLIRWHPGLICAWTLSVLADLYLFYGVRFGWRRVFWDLYLFGLGWLDADWKWFDFAMAVLQIGWVVVLMIWLGKCLLPHIPLITPKRRNLLCAGVLAAVLLHGSWLLLTLPLLCVAMDWMRFVLLAVLVTCAVADRRYKNQAADEAARRKL